ncbi:hypothetical protein [Nitrosomonas sp. ANs5]|uniref:hypothetical protein n=1 Tax=Nitrosomonas sp. ANs5 TaxID=3423941 RepID=UPI003D3587B5
MSETDVRPVFQLACRDGCDRQELRLGFDPRDNGGKAYSAKKAIQLCLDKFSWLQVDERSGFGCWRGGSDGAAYPVQ